MKIFGYEGYERKKFLIRYSNIFLILILVTVTIWYAISTHKMLKESRRQFEILHRPYLTILPRYKEASSKQAFSFKFDIENGGETVAKNVRICIEWSSSIDGVINISEIDKNVRTDSVRNISFNKGSILPDLDKCLTLDFSITLFTSKQELISRRDDIILSIIVLYEGFLSKKDYHSELLLKYNPKKIKWERQSSIYN